jgi:two-component system, LytTR family, sensor kinase
MALINQDKVRQYIILLLLCGTLGIAFPIYVSYSELGFLQPIKEQMPRILLSLFMTLVCGVAVFQIDGVLDKLISWRNTFLLRFMTGFVVNAIVCLLIVAGSGIFLFGSGPDATLKMSILFVITVFIYEIFYGWFYSYRYYAYTQVEGVRMERHQMELQFESLKNQISPHYLFNCLNTISSLLYKDSHMAEEFIRRMADTFSYVLTNQREQLIPLREEIEFVKSYYYLLQVRYEHHLKLEINLPKSILDSVLPPLSLQMLVENAVKHNRISKDTPLLVYISAMDNTHIQVTSTKTEALNPTTSFKVGLDNIRNRYRFFTPEKIVVRDNENFIVQLPVIRNTKPDQKKAGQRKEAEA